MLFILVNTSEQWTKKKENVYMYFLIYQAAWIYLLEGKI